MRPVGYIIRSTLQSLPFALMSQAILFWVFFFPFRALCDYRSDLYTENSYLSGEDVAFSQLRLRTSRRITSGLSTYLQLGQELQSPVHGTGPLFDGTSSFVYASPGMQIQFGPFSIFAEVRLRKFFSNLPGDAPTQRLADVRALWEYGDFFSAPLTEASSFSVFAEPYSETVFTSVDNYNVILSGYARLGVRLDCGKQISLDGFVEPFATVDRVGHTYYNHMDIRPGVRVQYAKGPFAVGLIASYFYSSHFPRTMSEVNPYPNPFHGVRALGFLSAELW